MRKKGEKHRQEGRETIADNHTWMNEHITSKYCVTVLVSTFALWRVLAAISEDVDLVDGSIRFE